MSNSKGTKEKCTICGFRKRGSNHDNGLHHQKALEALEALEALQKGKK